MKKGRSRKRGKKRNTHRAGRGKEYKHLRNKIEQTIENSTASDLDVVFLINSIYKGMIYDGLIGGRDVSGSIDKI
jgi:hypothetical protein